MHAVGSWASEQHSQGVALTLHDIAGDRRPCSDSKCVPDQPLASLFFTMRSRVYPGQGWPFCRAMQVSSPPSHLQCRRVPQDDRRPPEGTTPRHTRNYGSWQQRRVTHEITKHVDQP
jgi:hypothetical protein